MNAAPPGRAAPPGPQGGKLGAWIRSHRKESAAIAVAGGIGAIWLYKRNQASAAASSPSSTGGKPMPRIPATFAGQTDPSYGALEAQINSLQAQIGKITDRRRKKRPKPPPRRRPRRRRRPREFRKRGGGGTGTPTRSPLRSIAPATIAPHLSGRVAAPTVRRRK